MLWNMLTSCVISIFIFAVCVGQPRENNSVRYRYICPETFKQIGKQCYHFSNSSDTWFQAYYKCNLTVLSERYDFRSLEQYFLRNTSRHIGKKGYWIAAIKDWKQNKWMWYSSGKPVKFPAAIEEQYQQKEWICLSFDISTRRWVARNCMEELPYICQTEPKALVAFKIVDKKFKRKISLDKCITDTQNLSRRQKFKCEKILRTNGLNLHPNEPAARPNDNHSKIINHICPQNWISLGRKCYRLSKDAVTWSQAYYRCDQNNSKLAIVRSKSQDYKLRMLLNGFTDKQERWIGGISNGRKGGWIWAQSGQSLKYTGFAKNVQSNVLSYMEWHQAAIMMDPKFEYQWNFSNIMEKKHYICQVKGKSVKQILSPRRPQATIVVKGSRRKNPKYLPKATN
ncbi:secretory phospholipase A2 receptor-like isoform X2 [Cylas formicarius]|uniref:secretory phospholipase A2 receptor-like isoform X2 n=1 Tax=Cylas formicarius TaxID=197179 RepID=UPI00295870FE|nr:secretory phospholipase A2 receptor-like isoform X2 [Cylas formicarius]